MNLYVVIEGNAFKYMPGTTALVSAPVNVDGTVKLFGDPDVWSGEIEPPYGDMALAADRALHQLHNDSHLRSYIEGMQRGD